MPRPREMETRTLIRVTGVVQGVGFRPFVYNLARRRGIRGFVQNDSEGVVIEAEGAGVEEFISEMKAKAPVLSRIEGVSVSALPPIGHVGFTIKESASISGKFALVSADTGICDECLFELLNPSDRRYRYPFINCTNCGPRYSIVKDIPYDRPKTTMARFRMCPECEAEYRDPASRRFHAQPNACEECGPIVWLEGDSGHRNFRAIEKAQGLLGQGAILAIKGLGGFHLACDARNEQAVTRLREKKRKSNKPFAVMARDLECAVEIVLISEQEKALLRSGIKPIVLLDKKSDALASGVSPSNNRFGVMLPYTPLHCLMFEGKHFKALVMTSGNLAEEPIAVSNREAVEKFSHIADAFLLHNRGIHMRVDDSIVEAAPDGRPRLTRRARGYVPETIALGHECEEILAVGAELKNTFCITKGHHAILSQHIGDLENESALRFFEETLANLKNTFRAAPVAVAHDLHPDFLSTRFALEYARCNSIPKEHVVGVQHHHAHVVSVMAEHGMEGEVIGVAFDGAGLGPDDTVWGGEFLLSTRSGFSRKAHLGYMRLPGGDMAAKEPWRMAVSCLYNAFGDGCLEALPELTRRLDVNKAGVIRDMMRKGINSPLTSSAGRLFDAVSSLLGARDVSTFEAEAAMALETLAREAAGTDATGYPFELRGKDPVVIETGPMITEMARGIKDGVEKEVMALKFHATMKDVIVSVAQRLREESGINTVVLSGGVFQNALLLGMAISGLSHRGFSVHMNEKVPANDGGVSLGQAIVAGERIQGRRRCA